MTAAAPRMPRASRELWTQGEPLWVAALAVCMIVDGYRLGPSIIQFFGRGGQRETVEWAVYLSVLVAFPIAAWTISWLIPRVMGQRVETIVKSALLVLLAAEAAAYAAGSRMVPVAAAAGMSCLTVALLAAPDDWRRIRSISGTTVTGGIVSVLVGIGAWMSAGALVSWTDAAMWLTADSIRFGLFLLVFALAVLAVRPRRREMSELDSGRHLSSVVALACMLLLVLLSFRTNPVLELYHWEAYVGPMEGLRQGGWLLWDTPAQYGVLSILIPTLFPGNAWQSFFLFQAICNVVVALLMFWALQGASRSVARSIFATALTATTLFFRPRSATLLLAGQMTPSGGPPRFIWCFVMLGFLFFHYQRAAASEGEGAVSPKGRRFALWGNLIWIASILWSAEAAIYTSAIWFPAFAVYQLQRIARERQAGRARTHTARGMVVSLLWPFAALVSVVLAISAFYRLALGHFPDWMGYVEYALLYSGGFRALPIDPSGSVWFLLVVFLAISTTAVIYLSKEPLHQRSIVLAGAWGGVWAISSYFVSRSHPANLLSIATFLVFAAAILINVLATERPEGWHLIIRAAIVPVFTVPVVLTIGHPGFLKQITTPQLSYASFTEQIPLMEPSLNNLLLQAGAKPRDPIVRIGDGRLVLPAWRASGGGMTRVVSPYSWLPKQYEIIGTLPAARRLKYLDRNAAGLRLSGWLVHSKKDAIPDFPQQIADISRTHRETKRFENSDWIVSWYELKR